MRFAFGDRVSKVAALRYSIECHFVFRIGREKFRFQEKKCMVLFNFPKQNMQMLVIHLRIQGRIRERNPCNRIS